MAGILARARGEVEAEDVVVVGLLSPVVHGAVREHLAQVARHEGPGGDAVEAAEPPALVEPSLMGPAAKYLRSCAVRRVSGAGQQGQQKA